MLTPLDIRKQEFRRGFRGYVAGEVDAFMERIIESYEAIFRESYELKEKLEQCKEDMQRYRELEDVLKNTMILAQKNAEEMRQNAAKETGLLLDKARIDADHIIRQSEQTAAKLLRDADQQAAEMVSRAKKDVAMISEEYHRLEQEAHVFKARFRSFLAAQLSLMDDGKQVLATEQPANEPKMAQEVNAPGATA